MQPVWQLTRGRALAASLVTLGLLIWIWALPEQDAAGNPLAVAALLGAAFGVVLQRGRFCFYCNATDWLSRRRAQGLLAIIIALAVGAAAHTAIVSGWLADPRSGRLPLDGHIGPVSWVLFVASLVFGLGMAMSGSCLSAHMYRLGEGHLASVLALLGALLGFIAAFAVWNAISVQVIHEAPPLWLPNYLGYGGSLLLALLILAGLAWALTHWQRADPAAHHSRPPAPPPAQAQLGHLLFAHKWGPGVTGVAVGLIAIVAYVRLAPLGVTAEMGSVARSLGTSLGAIPERLEGLDSLRGCATVVKEHLWSANGVFVLGLVLASWASALIAGECRPSWPRPWVASRIFLGGILLGFGAMLAIGCTIGVLLSGIMIGAVSGWIFALGCFLGVWLGWWIRQRLAQN
ncbi:MAG: YeeE/YedE family protein [Planctomycetota bacterium]|nr:MAG: YeeE/YedE family protein [Planctomycetota bacterium]